MTLHAPLKILCLKHSAEKKNFQKNNDKYCDDHTDRDSKKSYDTHQKSVNETHQIINKVRISVIMKVINTKDNMNIFLVVRQSMVSFRRKRKGMRLLRVEARDEPSTLYGEGAAVTRDVRSSAVKRVWRHRHHLDENFESRE